MQNLYKGLGRGTINLFQKSPLALAILKFVRLNGIKIVIEGNRGIYFDRKKMAIIIGRFHRSEDIVLGIVHEAVHALIRPTRPIVPGEDEQGYFVERSIEEEVEAYLYEVRVVKQLLASHVALHEGSLEWLEIHGKGGRRALRKAVRKTIESTQGETYSEYYKNWHREDLEGHKRCKKTDRRYKRCRHHKAAREFDLWLRSIPNFKLWLKTAA